MLRTLSHSFFYINNFEVLSIKKYNKINLVNAINFIQAVLFYDNIKESNIAFWSHDYLQLIRFWRSCVSRLYYKLSFRVSAASNNQISLSCGRKKNGAWSARSDREIGGVKNKEDERRKNLHSFGPSISWVFTIYHGPLNMYAQYILSVSNEFHFSLWPWCDSKSHYF